MVRSTDAYLDIETTGLSCRYADITVVGIYLVNGRGSRLVQPVSKEIARDNLLEALRGLRTMYTYNGSRFGLPLVNGSLRIDLETIACHHDLMYHCWRCNLKGGFKAVEQQLGIPHLLKGLSGWDALVPWWRYQSYGDRDALALLLQYNREDAMNLKVLRERLDATGVRS